MAMIKCPECGKEISDKAWSCPNCGRPFIFLQKYMIGKQDKSQTIIRVKSYAKLILGIVFLPLAIIFATEVANGTRLAKILRDIDTICAVTLVCSIPLIPATILRFIVQRRPIIKYRWVISIIFVILCYAGVSIYNGENIFSLVIERISKGDVYGYGLLALICSSLFNTNSILSVGKGYLRKTPPLLEAPHQEEVLSENLDTPITKRTEEATSPSIPKINVSKENFFCSCLWKDLRFPLLWVPILSAVINALLFIFFPITGAYWSHSIDIATVLLLSIFGSIATNAAYLAPPLILRFLVFKQPMKSMAVKTLMATFLLGMMVKLVLIATGQSFGRSAVVPILQEIAIYYVLIAGANAEQYIDKNQNK